MPHALFRASEQTDKIDQALAKAQGKILAARRNAANPHFNSSFADLASIYEAIREPFAEAGIAVLQPATSGTDGLVTVTTRLAHAGQFYECDLSVKPQQPGPQALGSCVTYLKRYGLAALAGVPTSDDDDGEAAEGRESDRQERRPPQRSAPPKSNGPKPDELDAEVSALKDALDEAKTQADLDKLAKRIAALPEKYREGFRGPYSQRRTAITTTTQGAAA